MRVVGSGALNVDYFYRVESLEEVSPLAKGVRAGGEVWGTRAEFERLREALEKKGELLAVCGGGSAANTIYALSLWGFETGFIGLAGQDEEAEIALRELEGVDLSRVLRRGENACCLIILDEKEDRAIFVAPHSQEEVLGAYRVETSGDEWLHVSSLVTEEGFSFHRNLRAAHPGPFSVDPGEIYAAKGLSAMAPLLSGAELLFLTENELALLGGDLAALLAQARALVLKKGRKGAEILSEEGRREVPAASAPVWVDNTGAGDVFDAGVLAGILSGLDLLSAARLAAHLAALSLRDYGRKGFPRREEFLNLLEGVQA
ncbi:MAG: hypothetical protein GXO17_06655 [Thermodesulfobacteria bacterium]|nr:hypothetical protein [Thermodesulfobacteriota bacterium]